MLEKWSSEQKDEFAHYIARGHLPDRALELLTHSFPDAYPYSGRQLRDFRRSLEGKELIKRRLEILRKEAESRSYSQSGSRLDALQEIATGIFNRIDSFSTAKEDVPKYVSLCDAFCRYMESIRREMQPLIDADGAVEGWFEQMIAKATKRGIDISREWKGEIQEN